jgi:hypothetical protein
MSPLCTLDISPKYNIKIFYGHFNLGGRTWGRKRGYPQVGSRAGRGRSIAPRQLHELSPAGDMALPKSLDRTEKIDPSR